MKMIIKKRSGKALGSGLGQERKGMGGAEVRGWASHHKVCADMEVNPTFLH